MEDEEKKKLTRYQKATDMDNIEYFRQKVYNLKTDVRKYKKPYKVEVDAEYLRSIFPTDKKCPILGIPFKLNEKTGRDDSPSVDRIDNSLGYIEGNVQWVSKRANMIMYNAAPEEVMAVGLYHYQAYKKSKEQQQHETIQIEF